MGIPDLRAKAMLGGMDLGEVFFGIIHKGCFYFKMDEQTQPNFTPRGMKRSQPNGKQTIKSYYGAPIEVIEDDEQLVVGAKQAGICPL